MPLDFLQRNPEFLQFSRADLAKICIGAFMVVFMAIG